VSRQRIEDLDATIVRFANGAALVFKQTDFEKGVVNVQLRFGRGISGLPADRKSLAWLAPTVGSMGLGQLDADAIERLLTGRRMSLALTVGEDAWELSGTTNAAELQDQLHLLTAKLAAPRWDEALFARVKASALENYELSFSSASARAGREFGALSHAGDPRWAPFEREDVAKLTLGDVRAAFAPQFQAGPVELIVVGDVGLDAAVAAAARTVGALPARREASPAPASLAVRPPAPKAGPVTFTHQGDPNQAYALVGWSTFGGIERVRERRALSLAANIARVRLLERLRDIEGASYSPSAGATMSEPFPEWGIFYAASELRPERTELFFRLAREIVADLAAKPVAADEFERAQNPVLTGIERRLKTNAYWGGTMEGWSREPELIAQTRSYLADYRALTAEDVRRAVAAYVADAGDWSMLVLPGKRQSAAGGR
jgi:zinc protease